MPFYISLDPHNQRNRAALAERARLRGLAEQAREDRADVARALASVVSALEDLRMARVPASTLDDIARASYDAISERDYLLRKDIDAEYGEPLGPLYPAEEMDLSELRAFIIPRFDKTSCSQCGGEFGPGDSGFSHCRDHKERK